MLRAELDEEGFIRAVVVLPDGEEVPLAIETSRLLFGVDREAYKLVLNACREAKAWYQGEERVELSSSGGHDAVLSEQRDFPYRFLLNLTAIYTMNIVFVG